MTNLARIDPRLDAGRHSCRAVVETPAGSRHKYTYDPDTETFQLGSVLPEGLVLPLAFGFIPSTRAEDGDPLDVMIYFDEPVLTGILADVRLIGALECRETEGARVFRNDRLLAVSALSTRYSSLNSIKDVPKTEIEQFDRFWCVRNEAKGGKLEIIRHVDAAAAVALVEKAML